MKKNNPVNFFILTCILLDILAQVGREDTANRAAASGVGSTTE